MVDKIIKRIIRAAIESFPIDAKRKEEILRNIMNEKTNEGVEKDVL